MRILHYALGFPPYRTGGLTKFCMDIMKQQKVLGHEVALMWPGQMKLFDKSVQVMERKSQNGIRSFEVINPLPISYDEGIVEIEAFTKRCDKNSYVEILNKFKPDVIHVHTLMGLHKEFMESAKGQGIRTVFTVHDFFTICPKVTMFREGKVCEYAVDCSMCPQCNLTALPMKKMFLLQSHIYRACKDSRIVRKLRKGHRDQYLSGESGQIAETQKSTRTKNDYQALRSYYRSIIDMFDMVHSNSSVTKEAFLKVYKPKDIKIIPISHADIRDNRRKKAFSTEKLRLTYLGPAGGAKGYFLLKEALDDLWNKDQSFILNVFFKSTDAPPYMVTHGRYDYSELEGIFKDTDVLVVPSIWYETFGYTALEALSYGVPVIVSDHVGAKDVIPDGCGIVIKGMDKERLVKCISSLNTEKLEAMNQSIMEKAVIMTLIKMNDEIMKQCY